MQRPLPQRRMSTDCRPLAGYHPQHGTGSCRQGKSGNPQGRARTEGSRAHSVKLAGGLVSPGALWSTTPHRPIPATTDPSLRVFQTKVDETMSTKTTFKHALPDGVVATRTSDHAYTHVIVVQTRRKLTSDDWGYFAKWSATHANAVKTARQFQKSPEWYRDVRVEVINEGVRS
jgi:hypothetical protein